MFSWVLNRIVRWLVFNVLFAIIPISAVLYLRTLNDTLNVTDLVENTLEFYFFTVMISITCLADLGYDKSRIPKGSILESVWSFFLLLSIWVALSYGVHLASKLLIADPAKLLERSFYFSIGYAVLAFCLALYVQIRLAREEFVATAQLGDVAGAQIRQTNVGTKVADGSKRSTKTK